MIYDRFKYYRLYFFVPSVFSNVYLLYQIRYRGPSWPWSYGIWIYNYLCNQCISPLMLWVRIAIRTRCTTLCNKMCQWLATGLWFSLGPPVSPINKTDRHDIAVIVLRVAFNIINQANKNRLDTCSFKLDGNT
jgi:hypothetical protein